ncbi:MAG: UDP-N-acetylmuramoyl-L-alanyl-D-glutamate--2,6-diaminopimelate ligase [Chloroflexi bacterium]|nr:MAG: UDP-N-acetylmuramoyl-L-alanyl-D-glutamate--2,6-diaminopimelate ligase [Chloroflexota bacterium]
MVPSPSPLQQRLSHLLQAVPGLLVRPAEDPWITGVVADSRQVKPGHLFVATMGGTYDAHDFIPQAVARGARAVVGERPVEALPANLRGRLPYAQVRDGREALAWLSAAWYAFPARRMTMIGVTGTDGKTTTVNLIYAILRAAGHTVGMISTVNAVIGEARYETGLHTTTPDAPEVQRYLAQMVAAGTTHAVLEATSHGLAQHRVTGCEFDVAVVTNVTHEHLDYHGDWEHYLEAKARLFTSLSTAARKPGVPKVAVLNADDASFARLRRVEADRRLSYGLREPADVTARRITHGAGVTRFTIAGPAGTFPVETPLLGDYNVANVLAAATAALALEVPVAAIREGIATVKGIPGRMERIEAGQGFLALVDFAHTPNALRRALETARRLIGPAGRVIVVFGSAGLRDRAKRRLMGEVAGRMADLIVITAEDPRTESLEAIMAEIATACARQGRREGMDFWRVADRGEAIRFAVEMARSGDVVLVCGKGHEQSMCFGTTEYPWDDREAMRLALRGERLKTLPTA